MLIRACTLNRSNTVFVFEHNIALFYNVVSLQMNAWWNHMSPGRKVVASIIAANAAVFLMWRVQRWQHFMLKWFTSNPMSGKSNLLNRPVLIIVATSV